MNASTLSKSLDIKFKELEESQRQLKIQNENLRLIHELSNSVHKTSSVQTILDNTLSTLLSLSNPPMVAIYLLDKDEEMLQLSASHGFDQETLNAGDTLLLKGSLSELALQQGQMLISENFSEDDRLGKKIKEQLLKNNINSGIVIPLVWQQHNFGSVNLVYKNQRRFTLAEKVALQTVGKTVSLALANAYHKNDLDHIAYHDSLTGLSNRLFFNKVLKNKIQDKSFNSAILFLIDLDRFKEINDTLGHHFGDMFLQKIGPRLEKVFSGKKILLSRLGDDEFTILIYDISEPAEVMQLAQSVLESLREPFIINTMKLEIDASIGIAKYPDHGESRHDLLRSADVAMYEAKRKGEGIVMYKACIDKNTPERLALSAEFGSAIRDGQLRVHYQPKVDLKTGNVTGFEALVRWKHPTQGLLPPDKFIQIAEVSDAIHHLTQTVLDIALEQQKICREAGHHYSVSVNLSARNLNDSRCVKSLAQKLEHFGTDPAMLEFEITETALMQDPIGAASLLNEISSLGVKLSIDDYGTGYSSLSYLRRLPIDTLKIDREFVKDMLNNEQNSIIVKSTITLAHNLSLKVVAEGVENRETMMKLKEMGCDLVQGNYISKPLKKSEIPSWLAKEF